jgi:hypothetical protein
MSTQPHQPARKVGEVVRPQDFRPDSKGYPDIPSDEPGLVGGPSTEAVPGSDEQSLSDPFPGKAGDGGESTLPGRPRETGGERPPKRIPKTEGS